ncbi:MAG: septum site-determining protein MinD [Clostridia bacterium]
MSEVIVITSGKGGVGKTTTTANIGTGLASIDSTKKVVLIDTDIGLRNLDLVLGLENRIVYDIVDIVQGNCKIRQALIRDKKNENLFLLPAAQTKDKSSVSEAQMQDLIKNLREEFDYIIIDCPAGIEQGFKNAIAGAEKAIVVTTPEIGPVRDADRIIGLLEANGLAQPKLIINRVKQNLIKQGDMMEIIDILEILAVDLLGVVPEDESIVASTNRGEPAVLDQNSRAGQAYRNIVNRMVGANIPLMDLEEKNSIWKKFKDFINK